MACCLRGSLAREGAEEGGGRRPLENKENESWRERGRRGGTLAG